MAESGVEAGGKTSGLTAVWPAATLLLKKKQDDRWGHPGNVHGIKNGSL